MCLCGDGCVACFRRAQEYKSKDIMVRQGERADAMYAIKSGKCTVLVDPHYKHDDPNTKGLAEIDPKKVMQVRMLGGRWRGVGRRVRTCSRPYFGTEVHLINKPLAFL